MFRHVVMMQLSETTTDADAQVIIDTLVALPPLVPEIRSFSVGLDAGISEGNFDLVVVADFDDEAGYRAYGANADHQAIIVDLIKPALAKRSAVQYIID
ncbi:MAG: hypothetical protein ACI81L_003121 [Verrucomicrobiales bacterium]|jgi:hypothetical protein